jgi:hypothetical protein
MSEESSQDKSKEPGTEANASCPNESTPAKGGQDSEEQQSLFSRVFRNIGPTVIKTLLDQDAMRRVFSRVAEDNEAKMQDQSRAPGVFKPRKCVEEYKKAAPCSSKWEAASGGGRVRFCEQCQLQVYDFMDMDTAEARELVFQREEIKEPVLFKRKDGKFLTGDCPVGAQRRLTQRIFAVSVGALAIGTLVVVFLMRPTAIEKQSTLTHMEQPAKPAVAAKKTSASNQSASNWVNEEDPEAESDGFEIAQRNNPQFRQYAMQLKQRSVQQSGNNSL